MMESETIAQPNSRRTRVMKAWKARVELHASTTKVEVWAWQAGDGGNEDHCRTGGKREPRRARGVEGRGSDCGV